MPLRAGRASEVIEHGLEEVAMDGRVLEQDTVGGHRRQHPRQCVDVHGVGVLAAGNDPSDDDADGPDPGVGTRF